METSLRRRRLSRNVESQRPVRLGPRSAYELTVPYAAYDEPLPTPQTPYEIMDVPAPVRDSINVFNGPGDYRRLQKQPLQASLINWLLSR